MECQDIQIEKNLPQKKEKHKLEKEEVEKQEEEQRSRNQEENQEETEQREKRKKKKEMDERYFECELPTYEEFVKKQRKLLTEDEMIELFKSPILDYLKKKCHELQTHLKESNGYSVYTGECGAFFALARAYEFQQLTKVELLSPSFSFSSFQFIQDLKSREGRIKYLASKRRKSGEIRLTFLSGYTGILCALLVYFIKIEKLSNHLLKDKVDELLEEIGLKGDSKYSLSNEIFLSMEADELLFGRAGIIYSFIFATQLCASLTTINLEPIEKLTKIMIRRGENNLKVMNFTKGNSTPPLYYTWHRSDYLGFVHGLAGICQIILNKISFLPNSTSNENHWKLVQSTIDFILTRQFGSGNFPSRILGPSEDKLVQFCHGAPGVLLLLNSYITSLNEREIDHQYQSKIVKSARLTADCIWKRGLLRKGNSLCHGICGNAYSFLGLYNATKNREMLYYSLKFAEFATNLDHANHTTTNFALTMTPDCPYSLYEGIAGHILLMCDVLQPSNSLLIGAELKDSRVFLDKL